MNTETTTETATILYFGADAAILCWNHLGITAQSSGRTINGEPVEILTADDRDYIAHNFGRCACEICGGH